MSSRSGIWRATDSWVVGILEYCQHKIARDIGDKTLQREWSLDAPDGGGPEPTEEYHRGFDDGVRSAIETLKMISEGDL